MIWLLLSFVPLLTHGAPAPQPQPVREFQGVWIAESIEHAGISIISEKYHKSWTGYKYTVVDRDLKIRISKDRIVEGTIAVNKQSTPKEIDIILSKEIVFKGIYAVDGDVLLVCLQMDLQKKRPSVFSSVREPGTSLYILRKQE